MGEKEPREPLEEYIELIRQMDIGKLKFELSQEVGPLPDELLDAEEEQKKIPPKVAVRVADDGMKAWLTVVHPGTPRTISLNYFTQELETAGVKAGIMEENLEKILDGAVYKQEVQVAQGRLPVDGTDGAIRLLVNQKEDPEECIDVLGRVDFKKMRLKNVVIKGEIIAERIPPIPGKPGYKVTGEELPSKPVNESEFNLTPDVAISPKNQLQLIALKEGVFFPDFSIRDLNVINRDIDFGTGNIKFAKSLIIKGDVKSGFRVISGGDIEILHCVEDARVVAAGNVIVKEGFLGTGKGFIKGRNVTVGHVKQQKVIAIEDIVVGGEVMYSRLKAGGTIRVMGIRGIALGGELIAGKAIELVNAGNSKNIKTYLCVGYNKFIFRIDSRIQHLEELVKKAIHALKIYQAAQSSNKISSQNLEMLRRLELTRKYLRDEINSLQQKRLDLIAGIVERDKPFIKVTGTVFPNTTIQIGDVKNYVSKEIRNKIFILHKDRILEVAASSLRRGDASEKPA